MVVMKFGGSSVANAERIRHVATIIQAYAEKRPLVVLSAMGDTTDHLLEAAEMAVNGKVDISGVEALHYKTVEELDGLLREAIIFVGKHRGFLNIHHYQVKTLQSLQPIR